MDSLRNLTLFGVYHMDSPGKVTRELDAASAEADAIFVEYPTRSVTPREFASATLRAPVAVLGLLAVQLLVQVPLFLLFNRDLIPTEMVAISRVAGDGERPVHRVDEPLLAKLTDCGLLASGANWLALAGVVWYGPAATLVTGAVILAGLVPLLIRSRGHRGLAIALLLCWYAGAVAVAAAQYLSVPLLLFGLVGFVLTVRATLSERNEDMLDRIEAAAAEHGYEDALLVTGKSHLAGLARAAGERDLALDRIHVSLWRSQGITVGDVDPADLPEFVDLSLDVDATERPLIVPGSEQSVFRERLLAGAVDLGITLAIATVVTVGVGLVPDDGRPPMSLGEMALAVMVLVPFAALAVEVILRPVVELQTNATPGKRLFGLAVADADDGTSPSRRAVVGRGLCRAVDGFGFYALGALVAAASDRNQRIGDHLAGTVVGKRTDASGWTGASEASDEPVGETADADGADVGDETTVDDETAVDDEAVSADDDRDDSPERPAETDARVPVAGHTPPNGGEGRPVDGRDEPDPDDDERGIPDRWGN